MKPGNIVRIQGYEKSGGFIYLSNKMCKLIAKNDIPEFWLIELINVEPSVSKRMGGWSGIAMHTDHLSDD